MHVARTSVVHQAATQISANHQSVEISERLDGLQNRDQTRRAHYVRDVAHLLNVSDGYVWKLARLGKIKLTRVGARTLIFDEDLEAFIAAARAAS